MPSWSTDVQHLPPVDAAGVPRPAAARAKFTRAVVEAATSRSRAEAWCSAVRCIARSDLRVCGAYVEIQQAGPDRVEWWCRSCGDQGVVHGFERTALDLSIYRPRKKLVMWGIDDEQLELVTSGTEHAPALRAVIARAAPHSQIEELLVIEATVGELDAMYTRVEELTAATRSARRRDLLDDLRASLSTSIDGF